MVSLGKQNAETILIIVVLVLIHYHLGTLVLADVLESLDITPEPLKSPLLSRLYACTTIVNAFSLALSHDRYAEDSSSFGSILLRDPTPVVMVEVLARTGKAIFLLHETGKISHSTSQTMLSVIVTALKVICQVSVTASYVLTSFHQICLERNINLSGNDHFSPISAKPEHLSILSMCDSNFVDEFLQEMQIQASVDSSLLDRTIAKYSNPTANMPEISNEISPADTTLDNSSTGLWNIE